MDQEKMTPEAMAEELTPIEEQKPPAMMFSNRTYDITKYVAQILLPAVGALYFSLASIWGLPRAEAVIGTITVIDTFIGAVLLLSSRSYNNSDAKYDGVMNVFDTEEDVRKMSMTLNATPEELEEKKAVAFKVVKK